MSGEAGVIGVGGGAAEEDEDDDVDFGYWEKAELPAHKSPIPVQIDSHTGTEPVKLCVGKGPATPRDMDLSLL